MNREVRSIEHFYKYGLYVVFVLLIIFFASMNPNFLSVGNIRNILQQSAATGIAVVGLTFVMLTAGIDISIGSIMYFTASMIVYLISWGIIPDNGFGIILAIVMSILIGAGVGAINSFFISVVKIPPLITTIATLSTIRGITFAINRLSGLFFDNFIGATIGRTRIFGLVPIVVIILILVLISGQYTLKYTKFGRQIYAIGNNEHAAYRTGINVDRIKFIVYMISGATAGLSGFILGAQTNAVLTGFASESHFLIISAAILGGVSLFGGKGKAFPGAFMGVLIVICIDNGLIFLGANPYIYTIVRGIVIFIAVAMDCIRFKGETR